MIRETSRASDQAQVFVSYARLDAEQVIGIVRLLEQEGITIWRDGDRVLGGQSWAEAITHAIAHSRVFVLMCSPHSLASDNVYQEVSLAWAYGCRSYVPVWLSPVMPFPKQIHYQLARCQWIDAHGQPPERWVPQLLTALEDLGVDTKNRVRQPGDVSPTPAPTPTPKPAGGSGETEPIWRGLRFRPGDRPIRGADWELEILLGKGGFGEVWKAKHPDLPGLPPVALKFCLHLDEKSQGILRHEANMVLRAQQQLRASTSASANTSGIVPLVNAYLHNDPPCLEYPYVEGGTLVRLIEECRHSTGSLKPAQSLQIVKRVAQIVSAAHGATPKLVHRDLKPSNILVERRPDGKITLRVTDFGIGGLAAEQVLERTRSSSLDENMASVLTGSYSPLYASPQQMRGDKPDPRDDVYALGVIWYQLLTGDLTSPAPTGRRWVDELLRQGMNNAAVELLSSCFERNPAHRPDDAGVLAELLQKLPHHAPTKPADAASDLPLAEATSSAYQKPSPPARKITVKPVRTPAQRQSPPSPRAESMPASPTPRAPSVSAQTERLSRSVAGARHWVAAGLLGLAGLLTVILYIAKFAAADRSRSTTPKPADSRRGETNPSAAVPPKPESRTETTKPAANSPLPAPSDPEYVTTRVGQIKLKRIPAGKFLMGSPDGEGDTDEHPQHEVRITRPFYLGVTEMTRGQFRFFVDETGYKTEAEKDGKGGSGWNEETKKFEQNPKFTWQNAGFVQTDEQPLVNVSWNDAQEFTTWLSQKEGKTYRLPTEAEWEYACRAGTKTAYSSGDDPESLAALANIADRTAKEKYPERTTIAARDGYVHTAPVGRFRANAFQLYDMHGNVWEWCQDGYDRAYYNHSTADDPRGPSGASRRVFRGGSWSDDPRDCRSANRNGGGPASRGSHMGFRLAVDQSGRLPARADLPVVLTPGPKPRTETPKPAAASPAPVRSDAEYLTTRVGEIKLKRIPAGKFLMGSPDAEGDTDEHPQREVRITRPFYLGVYEINQSQYRAVIGDNPSWFSSIGVGKDKIAGQSSERHPVDNVSWLDAVKFCNKLSEMEGRKPFYEINGEGVRVPDWNRSGCRLPTEAEWEYACRASARAPQQYSFGDNAGSLVEFAWYSENSAGATHPVGKKRPNGFGLFDMHGNVWEWCWDCYSDAYYKEPTADDPRGPSGASHRVIRGGSWGNGPVNCRSPFRYRYAPVDRYYFLGFRLALGQSGR